VKTSVTRKEQKDIEKQLVEKELEHSRWKRNKNRSENQNIHSSWIVEEEDHEDGEDEKSIEN
jgi:hypothetical protein